MQEIKVLTWQDKQFIDLFAKLGTSTPAITEHIDYTIFKFTCSKPMLGEYVWQLMEIMEAYPPEFDDKQNCFILTVDN